MLPGIEENQQINKQQEITDNIDDKLKEFFHNLRQNKMPNAKQKKKLTFCLAKVHILRTS